MCRFVRLDIFFSIYFGIYLYFIMFSIYIYIFLVSSAVSIFIDVYKPRYAM